MTSRLDLERIEAAARMAGVILALPPELTLPFARERLSSAEWHERFLSERILEAKATSADIPLLRAEISTALSDDEANCSRLCGLVKAFAHLTGSGPIPELSDVFAQFRFSYGRIRAAEAMHATAPDLFGQDFALECLWDCEEETRALGAKCVPRKTNEAVERLRQLATCLWEDPDVQNEAGLAITNI